MISQKTNPLTLLESYADHCRVWIYQSNRELNQSELAYVQELGDNFVSEWNAHGAAMQSAFLVFYNRFIVLIADEKMVAASGCSIDSSVRIIRNIESELGITLLDRLNLAYRSEDGLISSANMNDFKAKLKTGEITANTIVFNNLVENAGQMKANWEVSLIDSWHKQLL